jgi:hypothetical protein
VIRAFAVNGATDSPNFSPNPKQGRRRTPRQSRHNCDALPGTEYE